MEKMRSVEDIRSELDAIRAKKEQRRPSGKRDWYGLVYCGSNGGASIVGDDLKGVWLGKADEIIPYLKSRRINGEDVNMVLQASKEFWSERKSQSYHSDTKSVAPCPITPTAKPNRITFEKNPQFLRLLRQLISQDLGIPTIQSKLKEKGYVVPYATLGRWVKKVRQSA